MLKLSKHSKSLPKLAKERYKQKLEIKCSVNPYIDDYYCCGPAPAVSYATTFLYAAVTVPHVMANQQMHLKVWMVSEWFVLRDG